MTLEEKTQMNMLKLMVIILFVCLFLVGHQRNIVRVENTQLKKELVIAKKGLDICSKVIFKLNEDMSSGKGCE